MTPPMRATLALALAITLLCAAPAAAQTNPIFQSPGIPPPGANNPACKPAAAHPYPVILVHGTFGDMTVSWNTIAPALEARGYCVWALDYGNRGTGDIDRSADQLVAFIAKVRSVTGAAKVSMIGHSQGGMLARYVTVRRGLLGVVDDVVGLAPSSHGTTNPLAGPAGVFGCTACAQQKAGSAFMRKVNQPPPEAPGPAWYTTVTTTHDEVVTPYRSQALAGDHATNVILQDRCPADPFEHVTIVGDPVALQWAINALDSPGAANPSFQPDCSGFAVVTSKRLKIALGKRTRQGDPRALLRPGRRRLHRPPRQRTPQEGLPDPRRHEQGRALQGPPRPRRAPAARRRRAGPDAPLGAKPGSLLPSGVSLALNPRAREDRRHVRLRDRGRRLGRLRAGQPPVRGPGHLRLPHRGGPAGQRGRPPHPGGVLAAVQDAVRLGLRDRAGARARRPQRLPPARPRARRLVVAQRDDLHPRQPPRLRRVARPRQPRLGLGRRPPLLQARRGQRARRLRVPRRRRPAQRLRLALDAPAGRRVRRGRRGDRARPARRLQHRRAGRRRAVPDDAAQRHALLDRRRLPAPRAAAPQPHADPDGARDARAVRRQPRERRRGRGRRHADRRSRRPAR